MLTIDKEKCNQDGICVAECPMKIIDMKDEGFPRPVRGAEKLCIDCGHCVAVCPTGALTHDHLAPEECLAVNPEWLLDGPRAEHFLRYRRSIRTYKKKPVDRELLAELIRIARYAPSGHNTQPVRWQVIHEADEVQRLSGLAVDWMRHQIETHPGMAKMMHLDLVVAAWDMGVDTISRGAPHLILANGSRDNPAAQSACTIALTYLDLAAPSLGLGTCWNGFFNAAAMQWEPLQQALGLEKRQVNFGAMMVGFPRFAYHRMPERKVPAIRWGAASG